MIAFRFTRLVVLLFIAMAAVALPVAAYAAQITVDGTTCTLPDAITAANSNTATGGCTAGSGADTLLLTAALYSLATGPYDHDGLTATPSVTSTIVISGSVDGAIVERSGVALYRLFHVGDTGNLTLQNVVVRYGDANDRGGAIFNGGVLTLSDSKLIANKAAAGGGIFNGFENTATLTNSDFIANTATGNNGGGGLYNRGTVTLTNCDFISNTATGYFDSGGGGIFNGSDSTATLTNSDFISNRASYGGGLFNDSGTVTLTDSNFISNTATNGPGGGLYSNRYSTATLTNSDFISNTAKHGGGGLNNRGTATLTDSDFISNTSGLGGGGLGNSGTATLTNSDFISNTTTMGDGGGLYNDGSATLTITHSDFIANTTAHYGGGIISYGTVTITNAAFIANRAQHGGGLFNDQTAHLTDVEIRANIAMSSGGGIYSYSNLEDELVIVTSHFLDNVAADTGSALEQAGGSTTIDQSCIVNNTGIAVNYTGGLPIGARNNWWGAPDGPGGAGPGSGDSVSNDVTFAPILATVPVGCPPRAAPVLSISKSANRSQAQVGSRIIYTYRITNTGNVTLTSISALDDHLGAVTALTGGLPPQLSHSATLTYSIQTSDLPGPLVSTVVVTGTDPYGTVVTGTATVSVGTLPPQLLLPQIERSE